MTRQHFPQRQTPSTPTRPRTRPDAGLMALYRADLDAVRAELAAHLPPLQREWGNWLRPWPWEWFGTFTFASPVHPEQADKRWRRWVWAIQHNGARSTRSPVVWVRGDEQQEQGVIVKDAPLLLFVPAHPDDRASCRATSVALNSPHPAAPALIGLLRVDGTGEGKRAEPLPWPRTQPGAPFALERRQVGR